MTHPGKTSPTDQRRNHLRKHNYSHRSCSDTRHVHRFRVVYIHFRLQFKIWSRHWCPSIYYTYNMQTIHLSVSSYAHGIVTQYSCATACRPFAWSILYYSYLTLCYAMWLTFKIICSLSRVVLVLLVSSSCSSLLCSSRFLTCDVRLLFTSTNPSHQLFFSSCHTSLYPWCHQ